MQIYERIMQHIDLMQALTGASKALMQATLKADFKLVEQIADNRDRLLNVIKTYQNSIEEDIAAVDTKTVTREFVEIVKTWASDVNDLVTLNDNLDKETTLLLETAKDETTKEIASVFKSRQSFKGYDLSSVKK